MGHVFLLWTCYSEQACAFSIVLTAGRLLIHRSYRVKWCVVSIEGTTMRGARGAMRGIRTVRCLLGLAFFACSGGSPISHPCAFSQHLTRPVTPLVSPSDVAAG